MTSTEVRYNKALGQTLSLNHPSSWSLHCCPFFLIKTTTQYNCYKRHYNLTYNFSFPNLMILFSPLPCSPGIYYSSSTLPTQRISSPLSGGGGASGPGSPGKLQRLGSASDAPGYSTTQRLPSSSSPSKQSPANRLAKSYRYRATVTYCDVWWVLLMYDRVPWCLKVDKGDRI